MVVGGERENLWMWGEREAFHGERQIICTGKRMQAENKLVRSDRQFQNPLLTSRSPHWLLVFHDIAFIRVHCFPDEGEDFFTLEEGIRIRRYPVQFRGMCVAR